MWGKVGLQVGYRCTSPLQFMFYFLCIITGFFKPSQDRSINEKSVNFPVSLFYRWSSRYDQWWECKFLSEGIIDQGQSAFDQMMCCHFKVEFMDTLPYLLYTGTLCLPQGPGVAKGWQRHFTILACSTISCQKIQRHLTLII